MIDFLLLYENIFKILPSGNIQKLMEVCYEIVGVPILTVDIICLASLHSKKQEIIIGIIC